VIQLLTFFSPHFLQKIAPAIYMTGTNVFIRGTTQFRAKPATLVFKTKRHFYFNFSSISN
ncbi:hypothetical protein MK484_05520, partial [Streptococcus mitis]|nr:hypothetical protein [Streptococcus mitis]